MRKIFTATMIILSLLLLGCSGATGITNDDRAVSTTYTISGTAFVDQITPAVGTMGCWDITDGMSNNPDFTATINRSGGFAFTGLRAGRDYYVYVWIVTPQINGWITTRSPYFYNLSSDHTIGFMAP